MMNVVRPADAFLFMLLAAHPAAAQRINVVDEAKLPHFDLASVKPHRGDDDVMFGHQYDGDRFTATGSLKALTRLAYGLQQSQLIGGADWADSDLYDIAAIAEGAPTPDVMRLMLRELLRERFMLRLVVETRELQIYTLSMARSDAAPGPQLNPAIVDCETTRGAAHPQPAAGGRPRCTIQFAPGTLNAAGVSMTVLADHLSMWVDRIVTDRTGLHGTFDLSLRWLPDRLPEVTAPLATAGLATIGAVDPSAPSIFTALREQLGLKLEPLRGPAEVLVVERVERPTTN